MTEGDLVTSMPLDEKTIAYIESEFEKMLGEKVRFTVRIDESIIGGFIANINGKVYDASLLARLKLMKEYITDY